MLNVCSKTAWLFQARNYCAPSCSNVNLILGKKKLLLMTHDVKGHHSLAHDMTVWHDDPLVTAIQLWCSLTVTSVPVCILGAMMHCSANIHVNCMQPIFHVTISTSFCPFDGLALSWLACSIADFYVCWELLCFVFPMFCFQSGAHHPWLALLWFWYSVQNQW